ncbi:MAG: phage tail family protein [Actinobacteria bacterium]|nr:phage tail family protein [Actinomycetota bacterium]
MEGFNFAEIGGVRIDGRIPNKEWEGIILIRLTGWRGLPGARGATAPIPGSHGSFTKETLLREPRSMELKGLVVSGSAQGSSRILSELETGLAETTVTLTVSDDDGTWHREVEVDAFTPDARWNNDRVPFTLDLIANDPIRYSNSVMGGPAGLPFTEGGLQLPSAFPWSFGTSLRPTALVNNGGAVPVLPVVTVQGSASSIVVHGGPRRINFGAFAGEFVIDNRERRAWLNGVDVTRQLVRRDWHSVPAGESHEFFFDAAGVSPDTTLSVEYRIGAW